VQQDLGEKRLSWIHYCYASIACLLMPLLLCFIRFWSLLDQRAVRHTFLVHGFQAADLPALVVVGAISFLLLLPFLKYPWLRVFAYFLICMVWLLVAPIIIGTSRSDIGAW